MIYQSGKRSVSGVRKLRLKRPRFASTAFSSAPASRLKNMSPTWAAQRRSQNLRQKCKLKQLKKLRIFKKFSRSKLLPAVGSVVSGAVSSVVANAAAKKLQPTP